MWSRAWSRGVRLFVISALVVSSGITIGATAAHADSGGDTLSLFYAVPTAVSGQVDIAGLFHGAPDTVYDGTTNPQIAIDEQPSCHDEGLTIASFSVTTDDQGNAYFAQQVNGSGYLVAHFADFSLVSNCYPVGEDNTAWEKAHTITPSAGIGSATGAIGVGGESRWYKVQVTPDSTTTVTLSGLTSDDSMAVYGDIGAENSTLNGTGSLNQLNEEFAADTFSPSAFIPSAFSPSAFIPSAFIPSAFIPSAFIPSAFIPSSFSPSAFSPSSYSPSAFIPSAFIPSAFIPSAFIPSAYSPSAFIPSAFIPSIAQPDAFTPSAFISDTYSNAVSRSLLTYNDDGGLANKTLTFNSWQSSGDFYIQVAGRDGATDPDAPFTVTVNDGSGSCSPSVAAIGSTPASAPAGNVHSVILTDSSRVSGSTADKTLLASQLQTLAARPEVRGKVIDLATNSRVQQLDAQADANPGCPYAENLVAQAIRDIVNSYRAHNPLTYVVIAGGDNVIPFFRHPDQTLIGNETGYVPPVADNSPAQAALRLGYTLSDNDYGSSTSLNLQSDSYPVPDVAVGRLVETATEITSQIQNYLGTTGGVLPTPQTSLVTGYDFLTYAADEVKGDLDAGIGHAGDTLIAPRTQAPAAGWTGTDLRNKLLNSGRHDIVFLAGHFSANDSLAADYTTDMLTSDMEESGVDLTNSLVFSAGCHSGYNIPDSEALPGVTDTLDWPQEFARKGAIFIGGTGYQYGDTDFVAYSEQLDASFAHNLRLGTGPVSIGQALLKAKQDYLGDQPTLDAIGQKSVLEATLYGLPMASINMPSGRIPTPGDTSQIASTTPASADSGQTLGLSSADLTITPTLTPHTVDMNDLTQPAGSNAVTATYDSGDDGVVSNPYQPVLPLVSKNVTVAGQSLRGAMFLGGQYTDTSGVTPLTGAPATEIRGVHTAFSSDVLFPEKMWAINTFDALDGDASSATRFLVTPEQHISDTGGATTDTRRAFGSMSFRLYYDDNTTTYHSGDPDQTTPALAAAPSIVDVNSEVDPNDATQVNVCADLGGDPAAGIQDAVATWSDASQTSGSWQSQHLAIGGCSDDFGDPTGWGATIDIGAMDPTDLRFMVQAVNGVGLVSLDDDLGSYFSLPADTDFVDQQSDIQNLQVSTTKAAYGSTEHLSATLTSFGPDANVPTYVPMSGETVVFTVGNASVSATTDDNGDASADLPLNLPTGTYTPSAAYDDNDGNAGPSSTSGDQITVTRQPTVVTLAPTAGTTPAGDTSWTASVCATSGATCGANDPPLSSHNVVFVLTGPVNETSAAGTNMSGQARFDGYGLPPGGYTLKAYFGSVPGLSSQSDPSYGDSVSSTTFSTTTTYSSPPTVKVPGHLTVPASSSEGSIVSFTASASDPVDPRPQLTCSPTSLSLFKIGTTHVNCTATDTAGNHASKTFDVTVQGQSTTKRLSAGTTSCNGSYVGTGKAVIVPAGAVCRLLAGSRVTGLVSVHAGGTLSTQSASIGSVHATKPHRLMICATSVHGALDIAGSTKSAAVVIGHPAAGCKSDSIGGIATLTGNKGPITLSGDSVRKNLVVNAGSGSVSITRVVIGRSLTVTQNHGAVTVRGSRAARDITIAHNRPGRVRIFGNKAGRRATCARNARQTGKGNRAHTYNSCPR